MPSEQIPEPWASFLTQVDDHLGEDDVKHLARTIPFDLDLLTDRYMKELRPLLGNPEREDLTLRLWIEAIEEDRRRQ